MKKYAITALFAVGVVSAAQAQYYGELAYVSSTINLKDNATTLKVNPNAYRAIFGYEVNPNLAVETMVAIGTGSKRVRVGDGTLRVKISNSVGLYVKPKFELSDNVEVFGRLGVARSSLQVSSDIESGKFSASKLSYGLGTSFKVTPRVSINADYMHYFKKDKSTGNGFAIGVGYTF